MDTAEFLRHILPSKGYYFLCTPYAAGGFSHTAFTSTEELAAAALEESKHGVNAYFALAGYTQPVYLDEKGVRHWREGSNAHSVRSFWVDIDCKKQYPNDQAAAITDMKRFCKEADLPIPNFIVNSGNGVHIYWIMDRDMEPEVWKNAALILKAIAAKLQFATDDVVRTSDIASVLRPIGTVNDKRHKGIEEIKPVVLLRGKTEPVHFEAFLRALVDAQSKFGLTVRLAKPSKAQPVSDFAAGMEYPPSSAQAIANHCPQVGGFRDSRGKDQSEPAWRACLGLVKHTVEGEELCHEWSSGHEGYDRNECQAKIDGWREAPTTCSHFRDANPDGCAGCKHKINSPIRLGFTVPESVEEIVHETVDEETEEVGQKIEVIPHMPPALKRRFSFTEDGLFARTENEAGVVEPVLVCSSIIVGTDYFCDRDDGGKWKVRLLIRTRPFTWIEADLDVRSIGGGGAGLMADLASKTMVTTRHYKLMEEYLKTWVEQLKADRAELTMHRYMGWQEDKSFVAGDTRYMPDGTNRKVILSVELRDIVDSMRFDRVGEKARYTELLNAAYNRPHHEPYHCSYLAAYASPLIALLEAAPVGIIFSSWSRATGFGKSTVARIGAGVWHDPTKVVIAGRTTPHAMYVNAGYRRNLLLVLDEFTQWDEQKNAVFAYDYSSGVGKEQGKAEGGLRNNSHLNWWNIVVCTGNKSQHNNIRMYNKECQAQLARVFEYEFTTSHEETMNTEEGRAVLSELGAMRGVYTAEFCEFITMNRAKVTQTLEDTYNKFMSEAKLNKDARFWVLGAAAVWVAYGITKLLGVHSFDGKALRAWLLERLKDHAVMAKAASVDYLSMFGEAVNAIQTGFIVTSNRGTKLENARLAAGWSMPRTAITGRVVIADGTLTLSSNALITWCKDNGVDKCKMMSELKRVRWVKNEGRAKMIRLGGYTSLPSPPVSAYELDWNLFAERLGLGTPAVETV